MPKYVDGFIVPVPKKFLAEYRRCALVAKKVWHKHGALDYVEAIADDVSKGKITSFPRSVKLKRGEVVFFSWIVYKSRADRDRVMKKVMRDEEIKALMDLMKKIDGKRMIYGGFKFFVS